MNSMLDEDEDDKVFTTDRITRFTAAVRIQAYARGARARRALQAKAVTVMQSIYREKQAKRVIHAAHLLLVTNSRHSCARPSSPVARPRCHALDGATRAGQSSRLHTACPALRRRPSPHFALLSPPRC